MFKYTQNIDNDKNHSTKLNDSNNDNLPNKDTPHKITNNKNEQSQKKNNIVPKIYDQRKLQVFTGIQNLIEYDDIDKNQPLKIESYIIEDDDDEIFTEVPTPESTAIIKDIEPTVCGALSSLMCDYGSSDEETKTKESIDMNDSTKSKTICTKNLTIQKVPEPTANIVVEISKKISDRESDDDGGPEEVKMVKQCTTVVDEINVPLETANNKIAYNNVRKNKKENFVKKKPFQIRSKPKVPSTLLQKLLHIEIRHERNVILQCIRFIVNNNYFDKKE